jgi:tRNA threonylcarbamoyladenosine biosynthesis protein TsaB
VTVVLAVDTATPRCSVALGDEHGVRASSSVDRDRRHVEALVPAIDAACRAAGVTLEDLDALAVDVGPGLFTGMRVGIATVQGLALALGLPVHPLCSLDVLAHPLRHASRPVAAVVDARRGEVFWALYQPAVQLSPAVCTTPTALAEGMAASTPAGPTPSGAHDPTVLMEAGTKGSTSLDLGALPGSWLAVGDGAVRYRAELEAAGAEVVMAMPSAEAALELALVAIAAKQPGLDPAEVAARYLRVPDARANFAVLRPRASDAPGAGGTPTDAGPSRPPVLGRSGSGSADPFGPRASRVVR